jgi:hypothetical protein
MVMKNKPTTLGVQPSLRDKTIPHTGLRSDGTLGYDYVMTEEDKYKDDYKKIKELVYYYRWIGLQQVTRQRDKIVKKFNLAYGKIDIDDYIKGKREYEMELSMLESEPLDFDLKFYPLIPNIINTLVSQLSKHYVNYSAIAVNREAVNEVIEQKNQMIRDLLIRPIEAAIAAQTDDQEQVQKILQGLPEVQKFMSKDYRLSIETWANNQLEIDRRRFKMEKVEKEAFFNKLVTDLPYVHINLDNNDYTPEVWDPRYTAYLKSPQKEDVSEAVMACNFEYLSPSDIIIRYGEKLKEEDIQKLESLHTHYRTNLTIDSKARYNLDTPGVLESAQNHLAFRDIGVGPVKDEYHRGGEYKERLLEIFTLYFQVPRKVGKVTIKSLNEEVTMIVDETYKVSKIKPIYDTTYTKEKSADTLVDGEHIEWFYISELWRCVKISLSTNPNPDYSDDIFVVLEKYPIQLAPIGKTYGSYIPVHGGPVTNKYGEIISQVVDKCGPWQIFFNYLWNRIDQLLQQEIGRFFAFNQNSIPQESMNEEWGKGNLLKWMITARDTKLAPLDTSVNNTGQMNMGATGGYGQMVDLTVTGEVIEKAKLAEICRNECLLQVGVSPQLLGDISPDETATGINQGIQRSITQLKYLFDEHFHMFEKVRQTMLECGRYLALKNNQVEQIYVNDEGERVIFQIPSDLLLHQLGVFVSSSLDDNLIIQDAKTLALTDNTLGASLLDKVNVLSAKSVSDIYSRLKELTKEKEAKMEAEREYQNQVQQREIESRQAIIDKQLEQQSIENQKDRDSRERIAETNTVGRAQFGEGNVIPELERLKSIQNSSDKYLDMINKAQTNQGQNEIQSQQMDLQREKLQLEREKILSQLRRSQDEVEIAKVNK